MGHGHDIPDPHCFLCAVSGSEKLYIIDEDEPLEIDRKPVSEDGIDITKTNREEEKNDELH